MWNLGYISLLVVVWGGGGGRGKNCRGHLVGGEGEKGGEVRSAMLCSEASSSTLPLLECCEGPYLGQPSASP